MSIKAGRVGVAPNQVDEFGNISSEATTGYTKQEADAKFETQTHAAATYETASHAASTYETASHAASTYATKTEAAELQPKTLALPIELLHGSALTVESALQGINSSVKNLSVKSIDTETISLNAGADGSQELNISSILTNGLKALGVVGYSISGSQNGVVNIFRCRQSSANTVSLGYHNLNNESAASITITVYILTI